MKAILRPSILLALALCATPLFAAPDADAEQLRAATVKLINTLVEQGVLTREKADALLAEANKPGAVRVPYMPEYMRKELKDEVELDLAARAAREGWAKPGSVPAWVRSLEWDGDLRTRYQYDDYASDNTDPAFFPDINKSNEERAFEPVANTREDRRRLRVRARAGLNAKLDEHWSAGMRLTTGSTENPISSNQTLGNYGNRFTVVFDRAYIRARRGDWQAAVGRFGNPWFSTDLVWANDLGFDGLTAQWTPELTPTVRGFATLGAMPIQEIELSRKDKWLYGLQIGAFVPSTAGRFGARIGLAYYHYDNIVGELSTPGTNDREYTAVQFAQKGNSYRNIAADLTPDPNDRPVLFGLASDFRLVNLTAQIDIPVATDKRLVLTGDYVRNVAFDRAKMSEIFERNVDQEDVGYQIRAAFGTPEVKKLHDWQVSLAYKRLERDAVVDAFTDGDFRLGGTDAKGYILGFSYGLGKNTAASVRYFSGDAISGAPLSIDVLQVELNVQF